MFICINTDGKSLKNVSLKQRFSMVMLRDDFLGETKKGFIHIHTHIRIT